MVLGLGARALPAPAASGVAPADVVLTRGEANGAAAAPESVPEVASALAEPAATPPLRSTREIARAAAGITVAIAGDGTYGAGIIVDAGHVLTCLHVVEKMKSIGVTLASGASVTAKLVDKDRELDLALLSAELGDVPHAELGSITGAEMGDVVFSMGTPRKLGFSLASGVVSYAGRRYDGLFYLQTDIPTNSGSSGGPVLDSAGRVIGVSSFILRDSQGLAFALPIDYALRRFQGRLQASFQRSGFEAWLDERAAASPERPAATRAPEPAPALRARTR